jgi:hypothetical protein
MPPAEHPIAAIGTFSGAGVPWFPVASGSVGFSPPAFLDFLAIGYLILAAAQRNAFLSIYPAPSFSATARADFVSRAWLAPGRA